MGYYGWVEQGSYDFLNVRAEARRQIKIAFDKANVAMPFPILSVKFDDAQPGSQIPHSPRPEVSKEIIATRDSEEINDQIEAERRRTSESDLLDD